MSGGNRLAVISFKTPLKNHRRISYATHDVRYCEKCKYIVAAGTHDENAEPNVLYCCEIHPHLVRLVFLTSRVMVLKTKKSAEVNGIVSFYYGKFENNSESLL